MVFLFADSLVAFGCAFSRLNLPRSAPFPPETDYPFTICAAASEFAPKSSRARDYFVRRALRQGAATEFNPRRPMARRRLSVTGSDNFRAPRSLPHRLAPVGEGVIYGLEFGLPTAAERRVRLNSALVRGPGTDIREPRTMATVPPRVALRR